MPMPLAMGSVMWKALQITSASRLPAMPVRMTTAPVRAAIPPSSEGGVLFPGEAHSQCQRQHAAKTDQRAHRDARDDGGGILLQQVPLFIQRDGEADGGRQQQVIHRRGTGLVVGVGDVQQAQKEDDKDAAQQQRIEDGLAGGLVDEGAQCEGGQRQQHAPRGGTGEKSVQQFSHVRPPFLQRGGW